MNRFMDSDQGRDVIQSMRGVAILMVLIHHALSQTASSHFENSIMFALDHVHVIIFFIISGYIFELQRYNQKNNSPLKFIKRKFLQLMVPYFFWSLFLALVVKFFNMFHSTSGILHKSGYEPWGWCEIVYNALTFNKYYVQHLWFIYVLFFFFIINYFSGTFFCTWKGYILGLIFIIFLFKFIPLNFIMNKFLLHFMNFSFGRVVYNYRSERHLTSRKLTIVSIIIIVCLYISEYFIKDSISYSFIGRVLWGIAGTILIAQFCNYMVNERCVKCSIKLPLATLGDYSYDIYLIHNPYVLGLSAVLLKKLGFNSFFVIVVSILLGASISIILSKYILRKNRILSILILGKDFKTKIV